MIRFISVLLAYFSVRLTISTFSRRYIPTGRLVRLRYFVKNDYHHFFGNAHIRRNSSNTQATFFLASSLITVKLIIESQAIKHHKRTISLFNPLRQYYKIRLSEKQDSTFSNIYMVLFFWYFFYISCIPHQISQ